MNFFLSLPTRTKILLLGAAFFIPIAVLTFSTVQSARSDISFSRKELQGFPSIRAFQDLLAQVAVHRGLTGRRAAGEKGLDAKIAENEKVVEAKLEELQAAASSSKDNAFLPPIWQEWAKEIQREFRNPSDPSALALIEWHGQAIQKGIAILRDLAVNSGWLLDPEADTYFLATLAADRMVEVNENFGVMRVRGTIYLLDPASFAGGLEEVANLIRETSRDRDVIASDLERCYAAYPDHRARLSDSFARMARSMDEIHALAKALPSRAVTAPEYFKRVSEGMSAQNAFAKDCAEAFRGRLEERIWSEKTWMASALGGSAFFVLLALLVAWIVIRHVDRSLARVYVFAEGLARGDLTVKVDLHAHDEFGRTSRRLDEASDSLARTLRGVTEASRRIDESSRQFASATQDLSSRNEIHSRQVSESSSTVGDLAKNAEHAAEGITEADEQSRGARDHSLNGGKAMDELNDSMRSIEESSRKVLGIVEVIHQIAFQTNLLALNASIEAARAGEAGRGFAVVAVEVRKLAQRANESSAQIEEILKESRTRVEDGQDRLGRAKEAFHEVSERVGRLSSLMGELKVSGDGQKDATQSLSRNVASLDDGTKQNAALAEEQASMAEELANEARALSDLAARFVLPGEKGLEARSTDIET